MSRGELVSDEIVLDMIKSKINKIPLNKGVILDGIPRTMPQATMLPRILSETNRTLDKVV